MSSEMSEVTYFLVGMFIGMVLSVIPMFFDLNCSVELDFCRDTIVSINKNIDLINTNHNKQIKSLVSDYDELKYRCDLIEQFKCIATVPKNLTIQKVLK